MQHVKQLKQTFNGQVSIDFLDLVAGQVGGQKENEQNISPMCDSHHLMQGQEGTQNVGDGHNIMSRSPATLRTETKKQCRDGQHVARRRHGT